MGDIDWPDEWPLLTYRNMHKGNYDGPRATRCLAGHARRLPFWSQQKVMIAIEEVLRQECGASGYIPEANDKQLTKAQAARVWNRTGYKLGYTEGNPESEPLPRFVK